MDSRLRQLRKERGLTQKEVATALNIHLRTYAHYELGEREPSFDILISLCDFFNVSADYLIGRSDEC